MATLNIQQSVEESLSSPSASLLPSLEPLSPLPITHLYGIQSYLSDWRADRRHARRPQPPAPARMAPESRRLSTAIPRPLSGTSRRLTSGQKHTESSLVPLLSPEKARRPPQPRPSDTRSGSSSLAYHLPRSLIPRSESLLSELDTSRHLEQILRSTRVQPRGLPKSQTTPALLSPNRDIASHGLLKPLQPPLPRSSTLNDVSVLQSPLSFPNKTRMGKFKICFEDTTMPKRLDVQLNRTKSPYPDRFTTPDSQIAETLTRTSIVPPYTVDGNAASAVEGITSCDVDPRFVRSPGSILAAADFLQVYTYEIPAYWTGRSVALMDRLRARTFAPSQSPNKIGGRVELTGRRGLRPKKSIDFARIEINIEKEAIKILRSFCQTTAATESFERFEFLLRKNHLESFRKPGLLQSRPAINADNKTKVTSNTRPVPSTSSKLERRLLSGAIPQRMFRKNSSTVAQPRFEKSATVASFSNTRFFISSSPEGSDHETKLLQQPGRAATLQVQVDCKQTARTLPRPRIGSSRAALRTPSHGKMNIDASRNFSHRDVEQMITLVDGRCSSNLGSAPKTMAPARYSPPRDPDNIPTDSSRRFKRSESIKQFVDFGIREVRKISIGKRRATSGTIHGIDGD